MLQITRRTISFHLRTAAASAASREILNALRVYSPSYFTRYSLAFISLLANRHSFARLLVTFHSLFRRRHISLFLIRFDFVSYFATLYSSAFSHTGPSHRYQQSLPVPDSYISYRRQRYGTY
jgi:hypothetical protein